MKTSKREISTGPRFTVTNHKGFNIVFGNGVSISVQWGPGNYCADYWSDTFTATDFDAPARTDYWRSPDAEVAIFWDGTNRKSSNEWLTKQAYADLHDGEDCGDDVLPAVSPEEVVNYMAWAAAHAPRKADSDD